jgi:hypothetical protein
MMMAAAAPSIPITTLRINTVVLSVKCFRTKRLNRATAYKNRLFFIGKLKAANVYKFPISENVFFGYKAIGNRQKANSQPKQYILYFCRLYEDVETCFGHIGADPALRDDGFLPKEARFPYVGG